MTTQINNEMPRTQMEKVYITASYDRRNEVCSAMLEIVQLGHEVTSAWALDESPVRSFSVEMENEVNQAKALANLKDIERSTILVCLSDNVFVRGGKHFETGYAYGKVGQIYIIGHVELMQHYLPGVAVLPNIQALYDVLGDESQD